MIGSFRQRHILPMMAPAAILRRVCWVNLDKLPTSFFRFARQLREKGRPRRIVNALSQTMIMGHAVDMQVLYRNDSELINNLTTPLMGEVVTPELNPFVNTCYNLTMLTPLRRSLCQFGMLALHFRQCLLFFAKETRIGNLFTCREGCKRLQAHINPDLGLIHLKAFRLTLATERNIPLASRRAMHCTRLDFALDGPMIDHLDGANLGKGHTLIMGDAETALRVGETIIASIALETRISRLLPCLASAKERLESKVYADSHILQNLGMNSIERGMLFFQYRIGRLLLIARQSFSILLIGILAETL